MDSLGFLSTYFFCRLTRTKFRVAFDFEEKHFLILFHLFFIPFMKDNNIGLRANMLESPQTKSQNIWENVES